MKKPIHSIRLIHESLSFCASHFITFLATEHRSSPYAILEPLHGHNFRVRAKITGPLNAEEYVLDFMPAVNILRDILKRYHHKTLLPKNHPQFHYSITEDEVEILSLFDSRRWIFPAKDILFLECRNATAESLAEEICTEFFQQLADGGLFGAGKEHYTLALALEEESGMFAEVTI